MALMALINPIREFTVDIRFPYKKYKQPITPNVSWMVYVCQTIQICCCITSSCLIERWQWSKWNNVIVQKNNITESLWHECLLKIFYDARNVSKYASLGSNIDRLCDTKVMSICWSLDLLHFVEVNLFESDHF